MNKYTLLILIALIAIRLSAQQHIPKKVYKNNPASDSASGTLKPYDTKANAAYKGYTIKSFYLTMRDSTKLAVDLYLPNGLKAGDKIPCILHQTRYWRRPQIRFPFNLFTNGLIGRTADMIKVFISNGYAIVNLDARGSGASFGYREHPWSDDEVKDGAEVLNWVCKQSWSNGKSGSMGVSYGGTAAEFLACNHHPSLKAIVPMFSLFDVYEDNAFPGGMHNVWFTRGWGEANAKMDQNKLPANYEKHKWLIKGVAPVKKEKRTLKKAVRSHCNNKNVHEAAQSIDYRDELPTKEISCRVDKFSPHNYTDKLNASAVAVYSYSGWQDGAYQHAAIKRHMNLNNPQNKLIIGPWEHGGAFNISPFTRSNAGFDHAAELLKFFDFHLKDIQNGLYEEPNIHYFTVGAEKWQGAEIWPPKSTVHSLFFDQNNTLSEKISPTEDSSAIIEKNSFGSGEINRWTAVNGKVLSPFTYLGWKERSDQLLHFKSAPLPNKLEISGHPTVNIYSSMNTCDGALFVYLEEEDSLGNIYHVTEGQLKASHRKITENGIYCEAVTQRSHSYKDEETVNPNQVFEMHFDLLPISWEFKKGSKIRISISGADKDIFEIINPEGYEIDIYHSVKYPSRLNLPLIPKK
jgi:putative CocE/NonD family hydrolase